MSVVLDMSVCKMFKLCEIPSLYGCCWYCPSVAV